MFLKVSKTFEIHCWKEENEWIDLALKYGTLKDSELSIFNGPEDDDFTYNYVYEKK